MPNLPQLTPRLSVIASQIDFCDCFADIGTDHAYLPVYFCITNKCRRAIAADIKKGPLSRAIKTVKEYNLNDKIELRLGSGLDVLNENEADVISIAGMGGIEISNILKGGISKISSNTKFILQPMSSIPELRTYLFGNGWEITDELLAKEDEKLYNIIVASHTDKKIGNLSYADINIGRHLIKTRPKHFDEYLEKHIKKTKIMIDGLENSTSEESQLKLEYCKKLLSELESI